MSKRKATRRAALLSGAAFATAGWTHGGAVSGSTSDVILPSGIGLIAAQGVQFLGPVCSFACNNQALNGAAFTATINWGDTTPATTGVVSGSGGQYTVTGSHTYTTTGTALVLVLISEIANPTVNATAASEMTVASPVVDTITVSGLTLNATKAIPFGFNTATFTDSNATLTASQFTATIDWGDGSGVVAGAVSGSAGSFTVAGAAAHTYASSGPYTVVTTAKETAAPSVTGSANSAMTVIDPAPLGTLTATVTYNSNVYTFSSQGAVDMGNYVDPQGRFTQRCLKATHPGLPYFTVMFRPDLTGGRREVVFELGHCFGVAGDFVQNMTAYSVVIAEDATTLATISAPNHWWFARWRWQSAPRPVTNTVASLISGGYLPGMAGSVNGGFAPVNSDGVHAYAGPMDYAGVNPNMTNTGDTEQLGPLTGWDSDYVCTGNAGALSTLLAQVDGAGSLSWHHRDETTGAPLDVNTYPIASFNYNGVNQGASPALANDQRINPYSFLNSSHEPALGYLPFLLTGDPYALEELQFLANSNILYASPGGRGTWNLYQAVRAMGWTFRSAAQVTKATPASVPSWLKPKSYWQALLNSARDFALTFTTAGPPYSTPFFCSDPNSYPGNSSPAIAPGCGFPMFMEDYLSVAVGFIIAIGFTDWLPVLTWHTNSAVSRISSTSGWTSRDPAAYHVACRISTSSPYFPDFGAFYNYNISIGAIPANPNAPAHLPNPEYFPYASIVYAGLALARQAGIASASTALAFLYPELQAQFSSSQVIQNKWSFT